MEVRMDGLLLNGTAGGIDLVSAAAAAAMGTNASATGTDSTASLALNVLVIGSQYDSSMAFPRQEKSRPFPGHGISLELEKILQGGLTTNPNLNGSRGGKNATTSVNVVFEERFKKHGGSVCFNLASWFHWPEPKGVQREIRWPNLRNQGSTQWDFMIVIDDPYTMEHVPGLYTHGVAKIAEEVAKTPPDRKPAEIVLLIPWPHPESSSTVDHYREVVYRTGRSGDLKVAPGGLAFEALGSPKDTSRYDYLAAATIYSRIWGNATGSSHVQKELAHIIDATVTANQGAIQYTGRYQQMTPFGLKHIKDRTVNIRQAEGGTSSEQGIARFSKQAMRRAGAEFKDDRGPNKNKGIKSFYIGRNRHAGSCKKKSYQNVFNSEKNKNMKDKWLTFGYQYHMEGKASGEHQGMLNIFSHDITMMRTLMTFHENARFIPRRIMSGDALRLYADYTVQSDGSHMGQESLTMCGTYVYTMISGRCPVDHQPEVHDIPNKAEKMSRRLWDFQKIGYEAAWHVGTLQIRAPGFKVKPRQLRVAAPKQAIEIIVEFINKPKAHVTVNVALISPSVGINLSHSKMVFTSETHNLVQILAVEADLDVPKDTDVTIIFATFSDDEVFNTLDDSWKLTFNHTESKEGHKKT